MKLEIDWRIFIDKIRPNVQERVLIKYKEKIKWEYILFNYKMITKNVFYECFNYLNWNIICDRYHLKNEFIEQYISKLNFNILCKYQTLSESFMDKYFYKLDTNSIVYYQKLSEPFIEKYSDKLNWSLICYCQEFSGPFIEKHLEKIIWDRIQYNTLSIEAMKYIIDNNVVKHQKIHDEIVDIYKKKTKKTKSPRIIHVSEWSDINIIDPKKLSSKAICDILRFYRFDISFINENTDIFPFDSLCDYQDITEEIIEKYIKGNRLTDLSWYYIVSTQKLSEQFIEKYKDNLEWRKVCRYQDLSEKFIEKYKDKVYWSIIIESQKISQSFIDRHIDKIDYIQLLNK